ncbi:hypothetical protein [Rhodopirellula islandica]|uniref:hypothetical protein n=1 Tax=Rhodopirellula islandica TaxID=595434 RepID=UPI00064A43C3|nr:hypothetical protein [Rhodopirellula islandica]
MRKRIPLAVGGGIALLIASQFLDFGLGFQSGEAPSVSTSPDGSSAILDAIVASEEDSPEEAPTEPASESPLPLITPEIVDVLIDGESYLVITNANQPEQRNALALEALLSAVDAAPGDASGIKVRISRTPSAIAMAEEFLLEQLRQSGLDEDEIDRRRQLVELPLDEAISDTTEPSPLVPSNETSPSAETR